MCRYGIWGIFILGCLWLTGPALAQSADDEQGTSEIQNPSAPGETALAHSPGDGGQGPNYQAPGKHIFIGRLPSKEERQSAVAQSLAQVKSRTLSTSDTPDFQNGRTKIYIGRLPSPEALRNMRNSGGAR